ncbi:MAG: MBL fold metallo-hydrolase [Puniceicoccales bacterium]|jgi:phosphoribosyl 1,2-cyclic phosphate phosphodiesterase|nr:MBL fold metallo-hydrolase [Puniceicoccales bacterium]
MEVIFLGTGTSQGVPMVAHKGTGLDLGDRRNWRSRASIHVTLGGTHVQVDAGPEFRMQCLDNDVTAVDFLILTHEHSDHVTGMDDLRRFCDLRDGAAIPVFSTDAGLERVRTMFPYALRKENRGTGYAAFDLHAMPPVLGLPDGSTIRSTLLPHGRTRTLGLVFEEKGTGARLAYYTDCKMVTPEAVELARGAEVVVLDGLRPTEHPTHMSIHEAADAAKAIGAARSFITHTTWQIDYATWAPRLAAMGLEIACDRLRLAL